MDETKNTEQKVVEVEENTTTQEAVTENKEVPQGEKPADNEPSAQELLTQVAKLKRQLDKTATEAKEWKEKFRSTQSEKEVIDAERAEAEAKKAERLEFLERKDKVHDLTENFMDLGYSKELAKKAAEAQADGDTDTLLVIQKQFQDSQKRKWEAEFIASRPEINIGTGQGKGITKEQFDNMSLIEKSKLRRDNKEEYDRLVAL